VETYVWNLQRIVAASLCSFVNITRTDRCFIATCSICGLPACYLMNRCDVCIVLVLVVLVLCRPYIPPIHDVSKMIQISVLVLVLVLVSQVLVLVLVLACPVLVNIIASKCIIICHFTLFLLLHYPAIHWQPNWHTVFLWNLWAAFQPVRSLSMMHDHLTTVEFQYFLKFHVQTDAFVAHLPF